MDRTESVFHNSFKERLVSREKQAGIWSNLASNIVSEILSYAGFDWVLFDTEHAPNDINVLISQLQAMQGSSTTPIVRPVWNDMITFKRLLDIGFHNFIVPFVQNVEEAQYAVSAVRYPPRGNRGVSIGARGGAHTAIPRTTGTRSMIISVWWCRLKLWKLFKILKQFLLLMA